MFDRFVIVDWSAANVARRGRDSIWIGSAARDGSELEPENPSTRHEARERLRAMIRAAIASNERVLFGLDFPFGYPAGFAARLRLEQEPPWRAIWDEITRLIKDAPDNKNNRFCVGAQLNRRLSDGPSPFPFWGCPPNFKHEFLRPRRWHPDDEPLQERRLIDRRMVGAQPCWKLAYTGSVGSQSLTGIPVVRALRDDPAWADRARVWPFETGLTIPQRAQIVFAEVWPSWWRSEITREQGEPNDRAQVRTVARLFAAASRSGQLAAWFAGDPNLSDEQRAQIVAEEAWTLGVTAPRRPSPAVSERGRPARRTDENAATTAALHNEHAYLRNPAAIYRRSFAIVRAETDLSRFPASMRPVAMRLAHAAGDVSILDALVWSRGAAAAGRRALAQGKPVLADSAMVAAGIIRGRLRAQNPVICTLADSVVPTLARILATTRSAAAVELWRPQLDGAVVAIGNAPTALFRLLELIAAGAPRPALVLGFPVGFVGAAEAKQALAGYGRGLAYIALAGRRGGSALAAAAVNALAGSRPR